MLALRATLLLLALAGAAMAAVAASATTGDSYLVVLDSSDQAMARRALIRSDIEVKIVATGSRAMSDASNTCQGFHPRKADLMVTGAAEASDASSTVTYALVKVFRTAQMAHADWQRTAVAAAARRCRLTQLRSYPSYPWLTLTTRRAGIAKVAPYQTAFLGTGQTSTHPYGAVPTYVWNVILVKGRTEIEFRANWGDTKGNESDLVADIARRLLARVSR